MSILSNALDDLLALLFPARCIGCNRTLVARNEAICSQCWALIPLTNYHMQRENVMELKLKGLCPDVESVAALFFYVNKGDWRSIIHHIKYHHAWRAAYTLGYRYGLDLRESPDFQNFDLVVPVPLHPLRQISRGYNQSELIARGMAKALDAKVNSSSLRRVKYNVSQVRTREKGDRWKNVQGIFALRHPERLAGKRILLVDDVYTTGATMVECIGALRGAKDCRISVATIAVSRVEIDGIDRQK